MIDKLREHLSSAHVIAFVALLFAIGGGLALANVPNRSVGKLKIKVNGIQSQNVNSNSINGRHVRQNSLTGADIDESTLNGALIPGIGAGQPGQPGAPGGGSPTTSFSFRTDADTTVDVFTGGGLTIEADCDAGNDLDVTAESGVNNSTIYSASMDPLPGTVTNGAFDNDFDSGQTVDLLPDDTDKQVGHTTFGAGGMGPVVDVDWAVDNPTVEFDCEFIGHATVG